jgi:short/branched chain acyl-CoA dehydrogenase
VDFELSEEHEAFRAVVRDFARNEIAPHAERWDREQVFPLDAVAAMAGLGLFGLVFPERWGGSDAGFTALCLAVEEIGRADQSMGITLSAGVGLGASPVYRFGSEAQQERWLPDLVAGRALGAFGLTEPDGGSDAGATRTRASLDGDEWVLDGSKAFITNSGTPITSIVTVTARTGPPDTADLSQRPAALAAADLSQRPAALAAAEISAFVVPAGTPGLIVEPAYRKLGWHASDTHGIALDGCRIPHDHLLGERGRGFRNFLELLDDGRISIAALAIGCAQACLDLATDHARHRNAFGGPIGRYQAVSFALADLAVALESARLLTYKAAWLKETGRPFSQAAAMAKLHATEAAVTATRVATQVFGGAGFMEESPVARFYRDAKVLEIGEGTSEIQRLVIARGLGLPV